MARGGQGQNRFTAAKEGALGDTFAQNIRITKAKSMRDFPYFHFDLYSGSGWNADVSTEGSPLVFLRVARAIGRDCLVHLVDKEPEIISELVSRLPSMSSLFAVSTWEMNNRDFCAKIPGIISAAGVAPWHVRGTILVDPNGADIPWPEITDVLTQYPTLDLIVSISAEALRRARCANPAGRFGDVYLHGMRDRMRKDIVAIRGPEPGDVWKRVILMGWNWQPNSFVKTFHAWNSPEARAIIDRLSLAASEKKRLQPTLFPIAPTASTYGTRSSERSVRKLLIVPAADASVAGNDR